jgi:apolipoprotein N-acyltransferase
MIWDEADSDRRFQELLKQSEKVLTNNPDLLVWPESAMPLMLRYYAEMHDPVAALAQKHKVWMIIGSDDAEPLPKETNYFNSSFLISPDGRLAGDYRKQHLVIFGEYVPLAKWMPFLKWFTPIIGGFTAGTRPAEFELTNLKVKTSVLICYEDVFPQLARKAVQEDTDFLVNITNDGWFGEGAAQWQQAAGAVFRTVENGVPLLRCANNGLTCWIDANGRMREVFRDAKGSVYGEGAMLAQIPLLGPGEKRAETFYHRHGDVFGWACVGLAGLRVIGSRRRNRSRPS